MLLLSNATLLCRQVDLAIHNKCLLVAAAIWVSMVAADTLILLS